MPFIRCTGGPVVAPVETVPAAAPPTFPLPPPLPPPPFEEDVGETPEEEAAIASLDALLDSWMAGLKLCAMAESVGSGLLSVIIQLKCIKD